MATHLVGTKTADASSRGARVPSEGGEAESAAVTRDQPFRRARTPRHRHRLEVLKYWVKGKPTAPPLINNTVHEPGIRWDIKSQPPGGDDDEEPVPELEDACR